MGDISEEIVKSHEGFVYNKERNKEDKGILGKGERKFWRYMNLDLIIGSKAQETLSIKLPMLN